MEVHTGVATMLPRERILAALEYRAPDVLPMRFLGSDGGFYDHGQKLLDLVRACGHDFGDLSAMTLPPGPGAGDFDGDGRYHAFKTDEWGTTWEYRIFGVWGHPVVWPLADIGKLDGYAMPPVDELRGPAFAAARADTLHRGQRYFTSRGAGSILEKMCALRRFEDVLMDVGEDTPEINRLADRLVERMEREVHLALAVGVDAIEFGDDFGTQQTCIFSPQRWREFFKPRYRRLCAPIKAAGKKVLFHSCGQITDLLADLREIGVDCIWPQLPAYDMPTLARRCRELGLAIQLHPDRGDLMQHGTGAQVREYMKRMFDTFEVGGGGAWLHVEIDPNFKWETTEALLQVAIEMRRGA
jgi:hypothetical protein